MGVFTNGAVSRIFATLLSFLVITINVYFVISYVIGKALAIRVAISYDTGKMLYISYVIGKALLSTMSSLSLSARCLWSTLSSRTST